MENLLKDRNTIQHLIDYLRFDFYDPDTVKRISMRPITDPVAFDNFSNPNAGGLHDPVMGVSAYDALSSCVTCGLNNDNCTGHFGHIELSAPVYNPFMMNYLLKIVNMKCFNCHKLRFHKKYKIYIFFKILLIKLGFTKEASMLKGLMFSTIAESNQQNDIKIRELLAKITGNNDIMNVDEESLINDESLVDTLEHTDHSSGERHGSFDSIITEDTNNTKESNIANGNSKNVGKKNKKKEISDEQREMKEFKDQQKQMTIKLKSDLKNAKSLVVDEIIKKIRELNEKISSDHNNKIKFLHDQNLNTNVNLKNALSEFWKMASVKCPNCNAVNSRIKKQGNKFFQQPLSKKQKKKMATFGINPNKDALEEGTAHQEEIKIKKAKKKNSTKNKNKLQSVDIEDEVHEDDENDVHESESDSEIDETAVGFHDSLKYLHPLEVKEHIKRLWEFDGDLLSLIFGNLLKKDKTIATVKGEKDILSNIGDKNYKWAFEISSTGPYIFFLETIIVPANRFRPENKGGGDSMYLNAQTVVFTKILNLNNEIRTLSLKIKEEDVKEGEKKVTMKDLISKWVELQDSVNMLYDSTKVTNKKDGDKGKGIRQLIEKKHGILRMKMMGKRVNFAGRSVISPDPMISASEVGIPLSIAQKLVFPETVTQYNLETLRQLVINGPKKYPGANLIAKENGKMISLEHVPDDYRINVIAAKLHEGKQTVYRHLLTGDALLVNRQPTLHKPSIMSHKAKVLKGENTIRLHYANCNTYNADFDGDEMNIHFLQNHIARQEAYTISNTDNQYIVPTSGKPIRGLIQDSIVSAVYLTMKDAFFTKEEYFQIVYFSLDTSLHNRVIKKICIQSPTILKPKVLFTGKQIITTVLKSLATSPKVEHIVQENSVGVNFQHNTRLSKELWGTGHHQMEGTVTVLDNELLTGVLDKNHIGNSEFGMVHSFYEIYGPEMAGELISVFGKLFIYYLQYIHGFTCGVKDIILKEEFNLKRRRDIEDIIISGMEGLGSFFEIPDFKLNFNNYSNRNVFTRKTADSLAEIKLLPQEREQIEKLIKSQNFKIENLYKTEENEEDDIEQKEADEKSNDLITELRDKFHEIIIKDETHTIESNLDVIVKNAMNKLSSDYSKNWINKGLVKNFPKNYFSMMVLSGAKGSLVNLSQIACMLGQQELEGKRVPRMASGRTLPSFAPFDANPRAGGFVSDRFSTGIRPQEFFFHCMAGREGLIDTAVKTSRSGYLQRCLVKHLEQLMVNYDYTVRDTDGNIIQFLYGEDSIDTMNTRYLTNFKFIANNMDTYFDKYKPERFLGKIDTNSIRKIRKDFDGMSDTLLNKYEPWKHLGSISDKVYDNMIKYMEKNPDKLFSEKESGNKKNIETLLNAKKASKNSFKTVVFSKFLNSMVQPGESVGILAAQSIGEPSTQMTLNTFHLAGHGGVNMTLGIPRLREILMTSEDNIKTPIMILPCVSSNMETIKKLARHFEKYLLLDIIKLVSIKQKIDIKNKQKFRHYLISIKTEDFESIKTYFYYNEEEILKIFKVNFIPTLVKGIAKQIKQLYKNAQIIVNRVTSSEKSKNQEEDDEKEENEADFESKKRHAANDESDAESNDENDYEDVEGTKNHKKVKEDTEENYTDTEDRNDTFNDDVEMNDEEHSKRQENDESEENSEDEEIKIDADNENEEEVDDEEKVKPKPITADDLIKEKNYSYEEVRVENMLYAFDKSTFCFELFIPFNQKNLLLKNILDQVFKKINFKSVDKVKKCHILERKRGDGKEHVLQLEGINFKEAVKFHEYFDLNRIYTNDIGNILRIYGVRYRYDF